LPELFNFEFSFLCKFFRALAQQAGRPLTDAGFEIVCTLAGGPLLSAFAAFLAKRDSINKQQFIRANNYESKHWIDWAGGNGTKSGLEHG